MPGTHTVRVAGHPAPRPGESYEEWEWRVLRTLYGAEARTVHSGLELLDPVVAPLIVELEKRLEFGGIRARRRETWRSQERQAYLFQQGRSRPGPIATTTLTSWHSRVDSLGRPASRAVDYDVAPRDLPRFHQIVIVVGLESFGADSNDPGHVFLPATEDLPETELMLLRLLPRVPVVSIATGLPVDWISDPAAIRAARLAAAEFAESPFLPDHYPRFVRSFRQGRLTVEMARVTEPVAAVAMDPPPACGIPAGLLGRLMALVGYRPCAGPAGEGKVAERGGAAAD